MKLLATIVFKVSFFFVIFIHLKLCNGLIVCDEFIMKMKVFKKAF